MDNEKLRKTNHNYSLLIHNLFGDKPYREVKSWQSPKELKKYLLKIIKAYEKSISLNIDFADLGHKNTIFNLLELYESQIKLSKTFGELDQTFISLQSELIFILIGKIPYNWREKTVRMIDSNWHLNEERTIIYIQNNDQKKNVIFEKLNRGLYVDKLPEYSKMKKIYLFDFNRNENDFMNWFKNEFPLIYLELF
jgi:hypothetical protein